VRRIDGIECILKNQVLHLGVDRAALPGACYQPILFRLPALKNGFH
jgi:hypothetical protein